MKKKLTTLLTLLLCVCSGAWAQTYTDEEGSVVWAFEDGTTTTAPTKTPSDAFLSTSVTIGSNLTLGEPQQCGLRKTARIKVIR